MATCTTREAWECISIPRVDQLVRMTDESKASRNFLNNLFWSCTTCNLRFWENDRTSGIVLFLQFHRIEQRHMGARSKIDWNHGSIWWTIIIFQTIQAETSILRSFTAHPLKVAHGIAALARHGINKLVQAASADPNTEFCSILSVSSPWWSLEKCTKTGMTNESKAGLWNHEGATF